MYYIEARNGSSEVRNGPNKWISAIFMDREKAETYLENIPEPLRNVQALHEIPMHTYPVYLVEGDEFQFCDLNGLHVALRQIEIDPDFDDHYLNIYKISEDFESDEPGADDMGSLYHIHVGNFFMQHYPQREQDIDPFVPSDIGIASADRKEE